MTYSRSYNWNKPSNIKNITVIKKPIYLNQGAFICSICWKTTEHKKVLGNVKPLWIDIFAQEITNATFPNLMFSDVLDYNTRHP